MAPGNGALVSKVEKDGWTTWNWHARSIHTYGSVLDVGPYKVLEGDYESRFGNTHPDALLLSARRGGEGGRAVRANSRRRSISGRA